MPPATHEAATHERANDLYWNSDRTIDQIVDELEIGRNTLYSALHPIPAETGCPECGEAMVFTNRTNRARSTATCRTCGTELQVEEHDEPEPEMHPDDLRAGGRPDGRLDRWRRDLATVEPARVALVGGAAALGIVVGVAATSVMRGGR
jgi:predicted RNA-binding Zn-ribbon protein involved in translation (DUF1610 family)